MAGLESEKHRAGKKLNFSWLFPFADNMKPLVVGLSISIIIACAFFVFFSLIPIPTATPIFNRNASL